MENYNTKTLPSILRGLYATPIICELSKNNMIDLYGHGWERLITRTSLWLPYIKNYRRIMSVYHGKCESKYNKLKV
jgi:hypothetical protein